MFPPGNRGKYSTERENIFPNCAEVKENPLIFPLEHVVSGEGPPGHLGQEESGRRRSLRMREVGSRRGEGCRVPSNQCT